MMNKQKERFCVKCGKTSDLIDNEDMCYTCAKERGRYTGEETQTLYYSVNWETDGEDVDLPVIVEIPERIKLDEDIADYLSNEYGWLVKSFSLVNRYDIKGQI